MDNILARYSIITIILIITAIMVILLGYKKNYMQEDAIKIIKKLPKQLGEWEGTDAYLEPIVYEILETKAIIHRNYRSKAGDVFLSIVYYPDTKVDFHAPEACLGGSGGRLKKSPETLKLQVDDKLFNLDVNQIIRKNSRYEELIYYFYKAGPYMGNNYLALRLNIAINSFIRKNKSGALIRISTKIQQENKKFESKKLTSFIEDIYPYLINLL